MQIRLLRRLEVLLQKAAKTSIEESTGKPVITSKIATELNHMFISMIETSADASKLE